MKDSVARQQDGKDTVPGIKMNSNSTAAQLTADGIVGSFFHRSGEPLPFFYNFVDYLSILAGESIDLLAADQPDNPCVATDPQSHLSTLAAPWEELGELGCGPSSRLAFFFRCGPNGSQSLKASPKQSFQQLLEALAIQTNRLNNHPTPGLEFDLARALCSGFQQLRNFGIDFLADRKLQHLPQLCLHAAPLPFDVDHPSRRFMEAIVNRVAEALRPLGPKFTLSMFHFDGDHWNVVAANHDGRAAHWQQVSQAWLPALQATFLTGFSHRSAVEPGRCLLCIPCHFAGVPWAMLCRDFSGDEEQRWWSSYATYRDVVPRLNYSLRLLAQYSYAKEMLRLFRETTLGNYAPPAEIRGQLITKWQVIAETFPIANPTLEEAKAGGSSQDQVLPFRGEEWILRNSIEANPFLTVTPALKSNRVEAWGADLPNLREDFIEPAISEYRADMADASRESARAFYAVGHPLKHRLRGMLGKLNSLCLTVERELPANPNAQFNAETAWSLAQSCTRVAEMMNLISAFMQSQEGAELRQDQFKDGDYAILSRIPKLLDECNHSQRDSILEFDPECIRRLQEVGIRIEPFSVSSWRGRLSDTFYDELFYEIFLNAARHGPTPSATLSIELLTEEKAGKGLPVPALVFSNSCGDPERLIVLGLEVGKWYEWNRGQGGLRFLRDFLNITSSGSLNVQVLEHGGSVTFKVRLALRGLTVGELEGG